MRAANYLIGVSLAFVLASSGCGSGAPQEYPVTGTVTWNGSPLAEGEILFVPAEGSVSPSPGRIKDGRYELRSVAGPKKVEIRATREAGPVDPAMGAAPQEQYLPSRYNDESTLTAEVKADGANDIPFALTD